MATTNIPAESHGSWSGTPRVASNQYIQDAIDAGSPGDTYILGAGTHRGQSFTMQTGDTMLLASGAIVNGAEDLGTSGWTDEGGGEYSITVSISENQSNAEVASGYAAGDIECLIVDGEVHPWYDSAGAVDADGAYHDGTDAIIGFDPTGVDTIEIARTGQINGDAVELGGQTTAERGKISGYASYSGGVGGYGVAISGTNPSVHDLDIFAISGGGLGCTDDTTVRNVSVHHCGQLGIFATGTSTYPHDITIAEGCHIYQNGIGGWDNGYEGGNCKWSWTDDLVIKGSLWDYDENYFDSTSSLWLDANNDGFVIYSNVLRDQGGSTSKGNLFIEISYSGKIYNNILIGGGTDAELEAWANGILMDGVGPNQDPGSYSYIYDDVDVYGNLLYQCAGGIGGVQNRPDYNDTSTYGTEYGYWVNDSWEVHDNTTYFDGSSGHSEEVGYFNWNTESDAQGENLNYDDNIYLSNDAVTFNDDQDGGGGTGLSWAQWNAAGQDTGTKSAHTVGGDYDPQPFNGGAM